MKSLIIFVLLTLSMSRLFAARPEPQVQMDVFFANLGEKGGSEAINSLCKGTFLETQKGSQLTAISPQLDTIGKIYGKITRIESVDKKLFGESFVRFRSITYHASGAPLFWEFMFFRVKDEWQVYVFRFNDQFRQVFSDSP